MSKVLTCLDIGSANIKGVVTERGKDGAVTCISAFKHPSQGFRKGVLVDAEDAREALGELIEEIRQVSKDAVKNVFVNIQSEHVKVRVSRGISAVSQPDKEIKQEDVDRAVQSSRAAKMLPNYKVLHTIVREFLVDDVGDIQDPVGMTGSRLEVSTLLVEAFAPHFDLLGRILQDAGADISGIVYNPFAASRAVLSKKQKELGVLMIDIGAGTTSFIAFEEMKPLFAKTIGVGGGHITNDIAVGLKVPVDIAERIKLKYGTALARKINRKEVIELREFDSSLREEVSKRFVGEIIEVRVAEIIDILNNELESVRERFEFPGGVVVTGGGVRLDGVPELIREKMGLPTQVGMPNISRLEIPNPTHEKLIDDPEFATALGLMYVGNSETPNRKNPVRMAKDFIRNLIP
ncbi:MAG: cell division protein FtsA [bacterium]|nr:cell division protein FtsA [bacterium]